MLKILFFPFGNVNTPSTRIRCYAFAGELKKLGSKTKILGSETLSRIPNNLLKLSQAIFFIPFYSILYFNKSAHWTTYLLLKYAKFIGKKIVIDVDDSEFLGKNGKWFETFFKECDCIIAGSHFVYDYAKKFNNNVQIIPTCVAHENYPKKIDHQIRDKIVIGWIGTETKYLSIVENPLKVLSKKYNVELEIISNLKTSWLLDFEGVNVKKIQWDINTANSEIRNFDIGIMPLFDTDWEKGKCAFKAIEYMAANVPVIISGVGENNFLVQNGKNGFTANNEKEWRQKIELLIKNERLRKTFAKNGLDAVIKNYNLSAESRKLDKILNMCRL